MLLELLIAGWITTLGAFHYFLDKNQRGLPVLLDISTATYMLLTGK